MNQSTFARATRKEVASFESRLNWAGLWACEEVLVTPMRAVGLP